MITKKCSKCKVEKKVLEFKSDKRLKSGLHSWCKVCNKEHRRLPEIMERTRNTKVLARDKNIEVYRQTERTRELKKKYNLTLEEYEQMRVAQNYECAICKKSELTSHRRHNVDHCHKTGKVRQLLCSHCNTVLGKVEESLDRLDAIKEYIIRHRSDG